MMEVYEEKEAWIPVQNDFEFSHTSIILKNPATGAMFYAQTKHRYRVHEKISPHELDVHPIPLDDIWPPISRASNLTRAPMPAPTNCYIKQPSLLGYPELRARYRLSDMLLHEAQVCETLKQRPHPNIAEYIGSIIENNRVTGLCFAKYVGTLAERLNDTTRPLNRSLCLQGIKCGLEHLHSLRLIHNDINPFNIMLTASDTPVIIDFDSCQKEGDGLGAKRGTIGWTDEEFDIARPENDYYGLRKIEEKMKVQWG
jgi:serine/threonine protein kinase